METGKEGLDPNAGHIRWNRELHRPSQPGAPAGAFAESSRDVEARRARQQAEKNEDAPLPMPTSALTSTTMRMVNSRFASSLIPTMVTRRRLSLTTAMTNPSTRNGETVREWRNGRKESSDF